MIDKIKKDIIRALKAKLKLIRRTTPIMGETTVEIDLDKFALTISALAKYAKDKKLPADAYIISVDDDEQFGTRSLCICYKKKMRRKKEDREDEIKRRFSNANFKIAYDIFIAAGFKRVGVNSSEFERFDGDSVYAMLHRKDYDKIMEYYMLFFKK